MVQFIHKERRDLIRSLHDQGMNYHQIQLATKHGWKTIQRVIEGGYQTQVRKCTRKIKCPSCGVSHKHTIKVELYDGADLRDE